MKKDELKSFVVQIQDALVNMRKNQSEPYYVKKNIAIPMTSIQGEKSILEYKEGDIINLDWTGRLLLSNKEGISEYYKSDENLLIYSGKDDSKLQHITNPQAIKDLLLFVKSETDNLSLFDFCVGSWDIDKMMSDTLHDMFLVPTTRFEVYYDKETMFQEVTIEPVAEER